MSKNVKVQRSQGQWGMDIAGGVIQETHDLCFEAAILGAMQYWSTILLVPFTFF